MIFNFINGEYRQGRTGRTFDDINPVYGSVTANAGDAALSVLDAPVRAARQAHAMKPPP